MFGGLSKDMEADVNGFQESLDLQSEYGESTSSEEQQCHSTILKVELVEATETALSSIEDGLKDMVKDQPDRSLIDHDQIRHSCPSHQILSSLPLEHQEQCCLNSAGVDFAATSKMKVSSIEDSSRNVFQDQKNESSDDSCVRQSGCIADITSDFSNINHKEQGRLIMLDSDETKDTSPTIDGMSKGSICNGRQHGESASSASVSSQFIQQDKNRFMRLGIDQAETNTTTSLMAGDVSTKLICNDDDQTRRLDSSAGSVSLEQSDQDR
ncbi:OLC1v1030654C1 [Oldenlandia corymbosa var. corymbosa]|uniref:OLC1v1030654C1 n=1 Tax=Oldenlandia corymbosa var. corymbosa TaxID=529605 RepID=A0AAV1CIE1_OLDCO|nr:OLC1v1030654C1 [Oldenlandia corymbosa var. corymbosa]